MARDLTSFDLQSAKRIAQATQWVEQESQETMRDRWYRRGAIPTGSALAFAKADIASGASGTVYMATGEPTSETASTEERTVYNTLLGTVTQDTLVMIQIPAVLNSGTTANWHIVGAETTAGVLEWGYGIVNSTPGSEQTITDGAAAAVIAFSADEDSGGDISADQSNNRLVIASSGFYMNFVSMVVIPEIAGAGSATEILGTFDTEIYDGTNTTTFMHAVNFIVTDSASKREALTFNSVFTLTTLRPNMQIRASAAGLDVDISQFNWLMIKAH